MPTPNTPQIAPPGFKLVPDKPGKTGIGFSIDDVTLAIVETWVDHMRKTMPNRKANRGEALMVAAVALEAAGWRPGLHVWTLKEIIGDPVTLGIKIDALVSAWAAKLSRQAKKKPAPGILRRGGRPTNTHAKKA